MNHPLVSVIIPTYNRKDMLRQAIDSVLAQDYPNIEIIVGDNASTDGTHLMMKEYCQKHPFINYIRRPENLGPAKSGQLAYKEATGDYVLILCDDDLLAGSSFFAKAVAAMEENTNIAFSRGLTVTLKGEAAIHYNINTHNTRRLINGLEFYLNYERPGYEHVDAFFGLCRKRWIDESNLLEAPRHGLDRWLWSVLPLYGDVYFIPEIIGYYREHGAVRDSTNMDFALQFHEIHGVTHMISQLAIERNPNKKEEILACRNPDIEAAWVIKFSLDIMRPSKSDGELLKIISQLKEYPLLSQELVKIMGLGLKNKVISGFIKFFNRTLKKIGIKVVRG